MSRTVHVNTVGVIAWVDAVMNACIALVRPNGLAGDRAGFCQPVANCFYDSLSEVDKANLAARQAFIALWPSIISSIAAIHPDPSNLVYGNFLWAVMFAATSGGTAGLASEKPVRYRSVPTAEEGRVLCLATDSEKARRHNTIQVRRRGRAFHTLTHGVLILVLGFYVFFLVVYLRVLNRTTLIWSCSPYWLGSLWYWSATLPALVQAIHRLLFNNITLFEEAVEPGYRPPLPALVQAMHRLLFHNLSGFEEIAEPRARQPQSTNQDNLANSAPTAGLLAPPQGSFVEYKSNNGILIWTRIVANQLRNRPYRLLVREDPDSFRRGIFELLVGILRLVIFIFGSVTQSSLIVMPTPFDTILLVLVTVTTFLPRVFWTRHWLRTSDGADLVVFHSALPRTHSSPLD